MAGYIADAYNSALPTEDDYAGYMYLELQALKGRLNKELGGKSDENKNVFTRLTAVEEKVDSDSQGLTALLSLVTSNSDHLRNVEADLNTVKLTVTKQVDAVHSLDQNYTLLQSSVTTMASTVSAANSKLTSLEATQTAINSSVAQIRNTAESAVNTATAAVNASADAKNSATAAVRQAAIAVSSASDLETELDAATARLVVVEQKVGVLEAGGGGSSTIPADIADKIAQLTTTVSSFQSQLRSVDGTASAASTAATTAGTAAATAKSVADSALAKANANATAIAGYPARFTTLETWKTTHGTEFTAVVTRVQQVEDDLAQQHIDFGTMDTTLSNHANQLSDIATKNTEQDNAITARAIILTGTADPAAGLGDTGNFYAKYAA